MYCVFSRQGRIYGEYAENYPRTTPCVFILFYFFSLTVILRNLRPRASRVFFKDDPSFCGWISNEPGEGGGNLCLSTSVPQYHRQYCGFCGLRLS